MNTKIDEIAPDVFRLSTFVEPANMQFNQFLVRDDEPLLYHTGQQTLFESLREAVASLIRLEDLRWIGFSHFEADESGALNEWLQLAPKAQAVTGLLCAVTNVEDMALRAPRIMKDNETFSTGHHTMRFLETPYIPHNWDSSLLFDETQGVLFCSDLFVQHGNPPAVQDGAEKQALKELAERTKGPFAHPIPFTPQTLATLERLAALQPRVLAIMHGASVKGDCAAMLRALGQTVQQMNTATA